MSFNKLKIVYFSSFHIIPMVEIESVTQLHPAHGYHDLHLPSGPQELAMFFGRCVESREFQLASSERQQVHLVWSWAQDYPYRITYQHVADFFGLAKSTIWHHLRRPFSPWDGCKPGQPGRPGLLSDEQLTALRVFIEERFEARYPASYEDCRDFLMDEFDLNVNVKSLRALIARSDIFTTVDGEPMEDSRIYSDPQKIDEYYRNIEEIIRVGNIPAEFIINIDEVGFEAYADARKTRRIVPARYPLNSIPVPVSRAEKRATLLAGICGDGTTLKPMVVLQRETIERELLLRGYTSSQIHFARNDTGYMTSQLFTEWSEQSFFPELRRRRDRAGYDGPILLILDGFGCHHGERFQDACEENNVVLAFIPPHTSDQVQPCDLGIFANQKRWQNCVRVDEDLNRQTKQVIRIIDSFRMATTLKNVTGAFRKSGIVTYVSEETGVLMARVDTRYATRVRHFANEEDIDDDDEGKRRVKI